MSAATADGAEKKTRRSSVRTRASSTAPKKRATKTATKRTARKTATKTAAKKVSKQTTRKPRTARTTKKITPSTAASAMLAEETTEYSDDDLATVNDSLPDSAPPRRAPTVTSADGPRTHILKRLPISLYITGTLSLVLLAGGLYVGVSDAGVIDVRAKTDEYSQTISAQQTAGSGGDTTTQEVPVQDSQTRNVPRLRPSTAATTPPPATDTTIATSSATSTQVAGVNATSTATSSDPVTEDSEEAEEDGQESLTEESAE